MRFEVTVQLKKEVLDTEGRAITETIRRLGFDGVEVAVSRRFVVDTNATCKDPDKAVEEIARQYLANPVCEEFRIRKLEN